MPDDRGQPSALSTQHSIVVEGLVKRFRGRTVVDGLRFNVAYGEIFALLGPNGAGKTTTVETLEGYQRPDGGAVRVLGEDPRRGDAAWRARIGVMLQEGGIYPRLRPPEVLRLFARYYARPLDPDELLGTVGLGGSRQTPYRALSGGERQRLGLAAALIGRPEVLFLDEPTAGMDPQARLATWELIRAEQARGVTVLLTTHFMDEAERLADRVAIIDRGRLLALDTPLALREASPATGRTLRVRARTPVEPTSFGSLPSVRAVRVDGPGTLLLETATPADALVEVTAWARGAGVEIAELSVGDTTLEETFLRLTRTER